MVRSLDLTSQHAEDPDEATLVVAEQQRTGGRGRPRYEFDWKFLQFALQLRGPTKLGSFFGCSARTVRRRALEYGLTIPGESPYHDTIDDDGTVTRSWPGAVTHTRFSRISDDDLDSEMAELLRRFPFYGRRM